MSVCYILGTAGSGKSTLTARFSRWLKEYGYDVAVVNLDPGAEVLPYTPDFDVREIVSLRDVMKKYNLGPNGGLLKSIELLLERIDEVVGRIRELTSQREWVLVDTPGQLELFAFRELGNRVVSLLRRSEVNDAAIFLIDATQIEKPADVVMACLIALAIHYHLNIQVVMVVNKIDVTEKRAIELFKRFLNRDEDFASLVSAESGVLSEMSAQLVETLRRFLPPTRVVAISALNEENFEDLFSIIHDAICVCGDLT